MATALLLVSAHASFWFHLKVFATQSKFTDFISAVCTDAPLWKHAMSFFSKLFKDHKLFCNRLIVPERSTDVVYTYYTSGAVAYTVVHSFNDTYFICQKLTKTSLQQMNDRVSYLSMYCYVSMAVSGQNVLHLRSTVAHYH